jgi:Ca-activated chloride channel family protein
MTLHFHSLWWCLLAVALLLAVVVAVRRRPPAITVSHLSSFGVPARPRMIHPLRLPLLLFSAGVLALIVALMRTQKGIERYMRRAEGIDVMLALDVSGSMEAYDIAERYDSESKVLTGIRSGELQTRIDVAKAELRKFVERRPNDRIGLIAFARLPYVVCPPTLDHRFLLGNMDLVDAGKLPDGTGIAAPVASATNRLKGSSAKRRVLVLFTDGSNNVDAAITPKQAAKLAQTFDVVVYTVGVGSNRSVIIANTPFGPRLRTGGADFNRQLLEQIADTTGGRYFEARDTEAFGRVMQEIDDLETTSMEQPVYIDYRERFVPWLIAGIALILLAFLLENTVLQTVP